MCALKCINIYKYIVHQQIITSDLICFRWPSSTHTHTHIVQFVMLVNKCFSPMCYVQRVHMIFACVQTGEHWKRSMDEMRVWALGTVLSKKYYYNHHTHTRYALILTPHTVPTFQLTLNMPCVRFKWTL